MLDIYKLTTCLGKYNYFPLCTHLVIWTVHVKNRTWEKFPFGLKIYLDWFFTVESGTATKNISFLCYFLFFGLLVSFFCFVLFLFCFVLFVCFSFFNIQFLYLKLIVLKITQYTRLTTNLPAFASQVLGLKICTNTITTKTTTISSA